MHKYPSWVLKEMDDEINDELITDSNVDLLLNVTPRGSFASTRGRSIHRSSQVVGRKTSLKVSQKVRRASQLSKMRRSSQMSTDMNASSLSPTKKSRLRHRQSSEVLKKKLIRNSIDEGEHQREQQQQDVKKNVRTDPPFEPPPTQQPPLQRPPTTKKSKRRSKVRNRKGKGKSRVASKAVKLLGASKSFVAAAEKRNKTGKLLRLGSSGGSSRRAILGSLRGILGRTTWRTCNVSLQPGILSFEDLSLDGSKLSTKSDHIQLTKINSIEMSTIPSEPSEYYTIKITMQSGDTYTFRSNDRTDIRHWEQAIVMARALSEGILLPSLGLATASSTPTLLGDLRNSSVESRGDVSMVTTPASSNDVVKKEEEEEKYDGNRNKEEEEEEELAPKRILATAPSMGSPVHTTVKTPTGETLSGGQQEQNKKQPKRRSTTPGVPSQWNRPCEFSVPLEYQTKSQVFPYEHKIPTILIALADHIVKHKGMETEGIFRITPNRSEAHDVRKRICSGELDPKCEDPHVFAHLMKQYFRDLPTNLMGKLASTASLSIIENEMNKSPYNRDEPNISNVLRNDVQSEHLAVLLWLLDFLALVSSFEHKNRMSPKALSVVMAPNMISMDGFSITDPLRTLEENKRVMNVLDRLISWRLSRQLRSRKLLANMTCGELKSHLRLNAGISEVLCKKVLTKKITGKTLARAIVNYEKFGVFPGKFADELTSKDEDELMRAIDMDRKKKWTVFRMRVNSRGKMELVDA